MLCKVDEINLEEKIKTWEQEDPENHFSFRPCSLSPTEGVSEYCSNPGGQVEAQIIQNLLLYIRLTMKNLIGREHSINSQ